MAHPKPTSNPNHWTLKPAANALNKGTYFRRLEDIETGLREVDKSKLSPGGRFLFLYYGCEKLAKGIIGIHGQWPADDAYDRQLDLVELKIAANAMKLRIPESLLTTLFKSSDSTAARYWRNRVVHDFGPTNVRNVVTHSTILNKKIHDFLKTYTPVVLAYLTKHYGHLLVV
jgi:hypothetical protein